MAKFLVKAEELKKAMTVAVLATAESAETIRSHALFSVSNGEVSIQSTDENKLAYTTLKPDVSEDTIFTADPKAMLALLSSADVDLITMDYDADSRTLNVYASEDTEAYVSFPSHNPDDFLTITDQVQETQEIAGVDSTVLTAGMKFGLGFTSTDDKNQKFATLYVKEGVLYAANGSSKLGLFKSPDFAPIYALTIRRPSVPSLLNFIDKVGGDKVVIKESPKIVLFLAADGQSGFGFRKPIVEMPKMPATADVPQTDGINVDRQSLLKKINRLSIAMRGEDASLDMTVQEGTLTIKTVSDRKSVERMPCNRLSGTEPMSFYMDCALLKATLGQYWASNIDIYVMKNRGVIHSSGEILSGEGSAQVKKPFTAVGIISLPRNMAANVEASA